jgi:hypothetical protein
MNRTRLEPAHHRQIREAFDDVVAKNRASLRLQLEKAVRTGNDVEVQSILEQLGPMALEELDRLDDKGVAPGNWGCEK